MKKRVNNFELQPEVLIAHDKPCRVYIPAITVDRHRFYWVECIKSQEVLLIPESELKPIKNGKVLYGNRS